MSESRAGVKVVREFAPYSAYKDSGIEWFGEIPAHWQVKRLKEITSVRLSNVDKKTVDGELPVRLCNYTDVYYHDRITAGMDFMTATASAEQIARFRLNAGDVLITKDSESWDDIAVPSVVTADLENVLCGYHLALLRPASNVDGRFLSRALGAIGPREQFRIAANGITRYGLDAQAIAASQIALPPKLEQSLIAGFIDRETVRIDALVAKRKRMIELLQEKRLALITRAVTKGLNANAPMKESGVEGLERTPAHWNVMKAAWLFSIGSGTTPRSEDMSYYGGDTPWITTSELRESIIESAAKSVTSTALRELSSLVVHPKGSVAVAMYGATIGRLGILGVDAVVNQACCVFSKPNGITSDFWFFWLQMRRSYLVSLGYGGGQPNLSQDLLRALRVPTPPVSEQHSIITFLKGKTARIDSLISKVRDANDRTTEFRTALISAAVTGKIDVQGIGT